MNLPHEISQLTDQFKDVEFVETTEESTWGNRRLPTINSLADVSVDRDTRILLLNSDCALYGPQKLILDVPEVGVILRNNYIDSIADAVQEQWGLDGFLLSPENVKALPRIPFGIGQPMWDYWMAWHMEQAGFKLDWISDRLLFHKYHPLNWKTDDCIRGRELIIEHYKQTIDWKTWREQQPYTFSVLSPFGK